MSTPARTATAPPPAAEERERVAARLHELAPRLRARGITHLSLFGSMARGGAGPEGDVDLLIDVDPDVCPGYFELFDLKEESEALFGRRVSLAFRSTMRPWFRGWIEEDRIEVV